MNVRTFIPLVTFCLALVGCRSTGSGPLGRALKDGPAALDRACSNGVGSACAILNRPATASNPLPILQGLTASDRTRLIVVVPEAARLTYFVREGDHAREVHAERRFGPSSDAAVDQVRVNGLRPNVDFELIVAGSKDGALWDRRVFRALDPNKRHARIALVSSADDSLKNEARRMWPIVLGQEADLLLLLGDTVYLDHGRDGRSFIAPDPAMIWRRHVETRRELPLFMSPRLVPTLATWDDHDFGYDNADATYPHREKSRDAFLTFFDQADPDDAYARGPGIASAWRGFGVELILADDRSFRSVDRAAGVQTHFGSAQEDWIVGRLTQASGPVWLASGDQFFGAYHQFESYAGSHPESLRAQTARWRDAARGPILFLSGDRHLSEVQSVPVDVLGFPTFEITSSGLHAKVFTDAFKLDPNPRQVAGVAGVYNFSVVEIMRAEKNILRLGVQSFGPDAQLLYQRTLAVKK